MTKKNIQCTLRAREGQRRCRIRGSTVLMASRALGHHGVWEDDGIAGPRMEQMDDVIGLGRTMVLCAREQRRRLGDSSCVVDGVTGLGQGRWWHIKGLDRGRERWCWGSGEDSVTVWAPRRSTMAWAPGKFLVGRFGSLTAWVKASED
jgi:hypothetical protein